MKNKIIANKKTTNKIPSISIFKEDRSMVKYGYRIVARLTIVKNGYRVHRLTMMKCGYKVVAGLTMVKIGGWQAIYFRILQKDQVEDKVKVVEKYLELKKKDKKIKDRIIKIKIKDTD